MVVSSTSESEADEDDFDIEHVEDSLDEEESSLVAFAVTICSLTGIGVFICVVCINSTGACTCFCLVGVVEVRSILSRRI